LKPCEKLKLSNDSYTYLHAISRPGYNLGLCKSVSSARSTFNEVDLSALLDAIASIKLWQFRKLFSQSLKDYLMKKTLILASLMAAVALAACGKKPEVAAPAPAPVAAPAPATPAPVAEAAAGAASAAAGAATAAGAAAGAATDAAKAAAGAAVGAAADAAKGAVAAGAGVADAAKAAGAAATDAATDAAKKAIEPKK
jgi:hypothetical protein